MEEQSSSSSSSLPSRIASLVHAHFDGLPPRSKPSVRPDGSREWTPMSGIVVVKGENTSTEELTCVAVTTGAKCLAASQIPDCRGLVLHDSHAEILAMRAFNYWLLTECQSILSQERHSRHSSSHEGNNNAQSPFIRRRKHNKKYPPFELHPDISIYMYCTCAPCGDASMELCMAAQEDATPWEIPSRHPNHTDSDIVSQNPDNPANNGLLDGRAHFSRLGVVRRKPARMDAEATRSKSCSDKLALRQVSSLLSYETSLLVAPTRNAYLVGIVLPEAEISREGCERSFGVSGRMKALNGSTWPIESGTHNNDDEDDGYGYRFQPFKILSIPNTQLQSLWAFAKPSPPPPLTPQTTSTISNDPVQKKSKPSNVSAIWTVASCSSGTHLPPTGENGTKILPLLRGSRTGLYENIINGVRQGSRATSPGPRGASALSRAKLWSFLRDVVLLLGSDSDVVRKVEEEEEGKIPSTGPSDEEQEGEGGLRRRILQATTYNEFKGLLRSEDWAKARNDAIQDAKTVLKGWIPNAGDEDWGLDVLVDSKKRKRV